MTDRPADYDPRFCAMQDKLIEEITQRVQQLVTEYHANNVSLAKINGHIDVLTSRVPADLPQQLTSLSVRHDGLHKDFLLLRGHVYALIGSVILSAVGVFVTWALKGGMLR